MKLLIASFFSILIASCSSYSTKSSGLEWEKLNSEAINHIQNGNSERAIDTAKKALTSAKLADGSDRLNEATVLNTIGSIYLYNSDSSTRKILASKAQPFLEQSLFIKENAYGKNSAKITSDLINLAVAYSDQKMYLQSESTLKRALKISIEALGTEHPEIATILNNLARDYEDQGLFEKAEQLYNESLVIREKTLGEYHLDVAQSLENIARLYKTTQRIDEATALKKRALSIRSRY